MVDLKMWLPAKDKSFFQLFLFILFSSSLIAQTSGTDSVIYKLTLQQILDSTVSNHPGLKAATIDIEIAKVKKSEIFEISPTEFNYRRGQLYTLATDREFEIKQNLGSLLTPFYKSEYIDLSIRLSELEADLVKKRIFAKVKSSYFNYVYEINLLNLINEQKNLLNLYLDETIDTLKDDDLDFLIAENQLAEIDIKADQANNDVLIAANTLQQLSFIKEDIEPADSILTMYEIQGSNDIKDRFPAHIPKNYYTCRIDLAKSKFKIENSKFFPELTLGYFNQSIGGIKGFSGWQAGINVPLWFLNQNAKVKMARLEEVKSMEEYQYHNFTTTKDIENSLTELNKLFEKLNYFFGFSLSQSELIQKAAISNYASGKINSAEFIRIIDMVYKIKFDYLHTLNQYDQKGIELEFYTY